MRLLTIEYVVKGRTYISTKWLPPRGLREGCPTSPVLFDMYHEAAMKVAEKRRKELAEEKTEKWGHSCDGLQQAVCKVNGEGSKMRKAYCPKSGYYCSRMTLPWYE